MIQGRNILIKLRGEVVNTTVYILNITLNSRMGVVTPYEMWHKTRPLDITGYLDVLHTFSYQRRKGVSSIVRVRRVFLLDIVIVVKVIVFRIH